jgi:hypothetical protein
LDQQQYSWKEHKIRGGGKVKLKAVPVSSKRFAESHTFDAQQVNVIKHKNRFGECKKQHPEKHLPYK